MTREQINAVTDEQVRRTRCPNSDCDGGRIDHRSGGYQHCSKWMNQSRGHGDVPTHYRRKVAYLRELQQHP
jgi:hypothetical protein